MFDIFNKLKRKQTMSEKLTNQDVLNLNQALNTVGNLSGVKFAYAVNKNKTLIEVEVEALKEAQKQSDKFQEFTKKRLELCNRLGDKDEKGNPKMKPTMIDGIIIKGSQDFVIEANKVEFDKELEALRVEYKESIDEREAQIKKFNEMLTEESTFTPHKIKLSDVPANITVDQMKSLINLIEE